VEPSDLTIRVLQEIREETRAVRSEVHGLREEMNARFEEMNARFEAQNARFEAIETTLRDLAQQMVMLARGIKAAIKSRKHVDARLDDHERRLSDLEKT
jgi:septal ring factor EnvC (AmiA/AmiB activator)